MIIFRNEGPSLAFTNFWDLPQADAGRFFVSINAGAFRLLVPASQEGIVPEILVAKGCAVSRGPWGGKFGDTRLDLVAVGTEMFEVLFDDETSDPFAIHLARESFHHVPLASDAGRTLTLTAWARPGPDGRPVLVREWPCTYRSAPQIPDLRPWRVTG